jgi:hypothetical protein
MQTLKWKGATSAKEAVGLCLDAIERIHDAFEDEENKESPSPNEEFLKECHQTLAYMWATSRSLTNPVKFSDLLENDMVQEACKAIQDRLKDDEREPAAGGTNGRPKRGRNKKNR